MDREAPLCIDLFCGLGGWAEGFLAEGYQVVGFDNVRHDYGAGTYPGRLVLQDVLTLHGRQFRNAAVIVASPPCQFFSYTSMPWSRAKALAEEVRSDPVKLERELALFRACFRLQREASEAAGRHIPMVVENVKGAQPWVGSAQARYGSYFLWGDVHSVAGRIVVPHLVQFGCTTISARKASKNGGAGSWFAIGSPNQIQTGGNPVNGRKGAGGGLVRGLSGAEIETGSDGVKQRGKPWFGREGGTGVVTDADGGALLICAPDGAAGTKQGGGWWHDVGSMSRRFGSKSAARKAASAEIAKIPFRLAQWVAQTYKP